MKEEARVTSINEVLAQMDAVFMLREIFRFKREATYLKAVVETVNKMCPELAMFVAVVSAFIGDGAEFGCALSFGWLDHLAETNADCREWLNARLPFFDAPFILNASLAFVEDNEKFIGAGRELTNQCVPLAAVLQGLRENTGAAVANGALSLFALFQRVEEAPSGNEKESAN